MFLGQEPVRSGTRVLVSMNSLLCFVFFGTGLVPLACYCLVYVFILVLGVVFEGCVRDTLLPLAFSWFLALHEHTLTPFFLSFRLSRS